MEVLSVSVNTGQLETTTRHHGMESRDFQELRVSSLRLTRGSPGSEERELEAAWRLGLRRLLAFLLSRLAAQGQERGGRKVRNG